MNALQQFQEVWAPEGLTQDGGLKLPYLHFFPHPLGDCLIAFQTAITSSQLYSFFQKMITMSYYFSSKNSAPSPVGNACAVNFNSACCLHLPWISLPSLPPLCCSHPR